MGGAGPGRRGLRLFLTAAVASPVGALGEPVEAPAALRAGERLAANKGEGPCPQQETGRGWSS